MWPIQLNHPSQKHEVTRQLWLYIISLYRIQHGILILHSYEDTLNVYCPFLHIYRNNIIIMSPFYTKLHVQIVDIYFITNISMGDPIIFNHSGIYSHELILPNLNIHDNIDIHTQEFYECWYHFNPGLCWLEKLSHTEFSPIRILLKVYNILNGTTWYWYTWLGKYPVIHQLY